MPPQSLAVVRKVLADCERRVGARHVTTLYAWRVLGDALAARGMHAEAESTYRAALKTSVKHTEERSDSSIKIRSALFLLLARQERLNEAMALHHSVKVSGADAVLERRRLADLLAAANRPQEAIAEYQAALHEAESLFGRDHVQTMNIRTLLAMLAVDVGHPVAEEAQRGVVADLELAEGPDSPVMLVARSNLAQLLGRLGRKDDAATLYREVLNDHRRVLGVRHSGTLITAANFANILFDLDRDREAVALFRELLPLAVDVLGPHHPVTREARVGHCCITAKGALAMPESGEQGPSGTSENRDKPGIQGLRRGLYTSRWTSSGKPIA